MTSEQIRAARMFVWWTQQDLASASGVSLATIKRLESKPGRLKAYRPTLDAIQRAFAAVGVELIPENGGGPGVRLKKPSSGG